MQLALSFSTLLACLLITLASVDNAQAVPAKRSGNIVTLPLKRVNGARSDIHPQVVSGHCSFAVHREIQIICNCCQLFQQHLNRGLKRYAKMTKREQPSKRELEDKLHRRVATHAPYARTEKRFYRHGTSGTRPNEDFGHGKYGG